jgi:hypothetical protein
MLEKAKRRAGNRSPLMEPCKVRRFDWLPADLDMMSAVYSAAASVIG